MGIKTYLKIISLLIFLFSCSLGADYNSSKYNITILSSQPYYIDSVIVFSIDSEGSDYQWTSDLDGVIGYGRTISTSLSTGFHNISVAKGHNIISDINITIQNTPYIYGDSKKILLANKSNSIYLPSGHYSTVITSLSNETMNFSFNEPSNNLQSKGLNSTHFNRKMFKADFEIKSKDTIYFNNRSLTLEDRCFIVADTTGVEKEGMLIESKLLYQNDFLELWVDKNSELDSELYLELYNKLNSIVLPRHRCLWGKLPDINKDNKIAILITPEINIQGKAIGFFNPNDFYSYSSENLVTNEMDIIYLGDSTYDPYALSYSINSILATAAHELTHLITFAAKVYYREQAGVEKAVREELFLDEGLAHLSESLCGFGVSGGNIAFFDKFLKNPELYSFNSVNIFGVEDSVGRRGFVSGFLSWLFWYQGGGIWDNMKPEIIQDSGGITFLKKLLYSDKIGIENIDYALDGEFQVLFQQWANELYSKKVLGSSTHNIKIDPVLGEYLELDPFVGEIVSAGLKCNLEGPNLISLNTNIKVLPLSMVFFEGFYNMKPGNITIFGEENKGLVLAHFNMY